jgi:hypothetical protein
MTRAEAFFHSGLEAGCHWRIIPSQHEHNLSRPRRHLWLGGGRGSYFIYVFNLCPARTASAPGKVNRPKFNGDWATFAELMAYTMWSLRNCTPTSFGVCPSQRWHKRLHSVHCDHPPGSPKLETNHFPLPDYPKQLGSRVISAVLPLFLSWSFLVPPCHGFTTEHTPMPYEISRAAPAHNSITDY